MSLYKNLKTALSEREKVSVLKITLKEKILPEELFVFPQLTELYLDLPLLTEWPAKIQGWDQLQQIQIKAPMLKGGLAPLFSLRSLTHLKTVETPLEPLRLSIGHTRAPLRSLSLKDAGLKALPLELGDIDTLEEIYLPGNMLKDLPLSFKELKKLKRMNLDQNDFKVFPKALAGHPSLKHLSLDGNAFSQDEKDRIQREYGITVA